MNTPALSSRAQLEILDVVEWISRDNPGAAQAFLNAVGAAIERITAHPEIGVVRRDWARGPHRFLIMTSFPYVIAYRVGEGRPRILRVVHGARDLPRAFQYLGVDDE